MKDINKNNLSRIILKYGMATVGIVVVFVFTDARAENAVRTYDETFHAGHGAVVQMSIRDGETNEDAYTLPRDPHGLYAREHTVNIGTFVAAHPFILLSARWDESAAEGITEQKVSVRTRVSAHEPWSVWTELERLKDFRDGRDVIAGHVRTEPFFTERSREFEVRLLLTTHNPSITPQVSNIDFTIIGTEHGGSEIVNAALNSTDDPNIISRASWAADESLRIAPDGSAAWPETYGEVKAFVIHHTGGTNGGADPTATVRAIQRYHGKTLGWGDIGYNYLIAPDGRIFEGRAGGEAVVGGHTYNDKKKMGYNTGTIGIAILGNYNGEERLTNAVKEALAKLIAEKSFEHEIIPQGESTLKDLVIPAVIAHRDIDATICPGTGITTELLEVRQMAAARLDALGGLAAIIRHATLLTQSDISILIKPGQAKTIMITYRNDGNTHWKNYLNQPVQLADASIKSRLTMFMGGTVAASFAPGAVRMAQVIDDEVRPVETQIIPLSALTFAQPNIAPGQTVTIPLTITMPMNAVGVEERSYVLTWGNKGYFPGSDFHIAIETTETEWAGKIELLETPTTTRTGVLTHGAVRVRNRGLKTWLKGSVMLLLTDVAGGNPKWDVAGWPLPMGRILSNEAMVAPNEVATFPLSLTSTVPGNFETQLSFRYLSDVGTVPSTLLATLKLPSLPGAEGSFVATVLPSGQIELIKPQFPTRIRAGRTVYFTLRVKNTGDKVLKGGKSVYLTQTATRGDKSPFYVKSDWLSDTKPSYLWQSVVKPGKEGSFTWRMKAPAKKGAYTETLTFTTTDGGGLINGKPAFTFTIKVE